MHNKAQPWSSTLLSADPAISALAAGKCEAAADTLASSLPAWDQDAAKPTATCCAHHVDHTRRQHAEPGVWLTSAWHCLWMLMGPRQTKKRSTRPACPSISPNNRSQRRQGSSRIALHKGVKSSTDGCSVQGPCSCHSKCPLSHKASWHSLVCTPGGSGSQRMC